MPSTAASPKHDKRNVHRRQPGRGRHFTDYLPLIAIVAVVALSAAALQWPASIWDGRIYMRHFTGLFLVIFAMFKLFDLPGFADGFQMYDLIAKPFRPYALAYPFIELFLGLASLADVFPLARNLALLILMLIGSAGVLSALIRGLDVNCACLGNILKVPLSTVAVAEDLGMAGMAAWMLLTG
jgi:hypothetical protein